MVLTGIWTNRHIVQKIEIAQPASRQMWHDGLPSSFSHSSHLHRTNQTTKIKLIRLDNVKGIVGDKPSKGVNTELLFTTGHRDGHRIRDLFLLLIPIPRHRFFVEIVIVLF